MKRRSGFTLPEMLVSALIAGIVMTGFFEASVYLWKAQTFSVNMPTVQQNARQMALTVSKQLRGAQLCTSSDTGCTLNAAVQSASATAVTIYSHSSGALVKTTYGVNSGTFYSQVSGQGVNNIYTGATLALTYYTSTPLGYHTSSLTAYSPTDGTGGTASELIAVAISTSITSNGITATYTTLVRLRNSPPKASPYA